MSVTTRRVSVRDNMVSSPTRPKASFGTRHVQALLMTAGFLCCYSIRVIMSIAIVAMTTKNGSNHEPINWGEQTQSLILSSFFWGYAVTQLPGGILAQKFGGQRLFGYSVGLCGISTLIIPMAAFSENWILVCICRVICGFCQGVVPPVIHTLLAKWIPLQERGTYTSIVYSGGWVGNVIALLTSGYLSDSKPGWPACFYVWGFVTVVWAIVWHLFGKESPAEHSKIPDDERAYIESSLGVVETSVPLRTPWSSILTSIPVWALLIAQSAQSWGFWMLLTKIPKYMESVLKYNIQENGAMSSLPYFCAWLMNFPISFASDYAIRTNKVTLKTSRMICNTVGQLVPAIALTLLAYVKNEDGLIAVLILTIAVSANVSIYCGHHANHMDLSPNFSGTLMGFTNMSAACCSIAAPLVAGFVVSDSTNKHQWNHIFLITASIFILGAVIFLFFGAVKVQSWNDAPVIESRKNSKLFGIPEIPTPTESIKKYDYTITDEKFER